MYPVVSNSRFARTFVHHQKDRVEIDDRGGQLIAPIACVALLGAGCVRSLGRNDEDVAGKLILPREATKRSASWGERLSEKLILSRLDEKIVHRAACESLYPIRKG